MPGYLRAWSLGRTIVGALLGCLYACTSTEDATLTGGVGPTIISTPIDARPAALINGRMVEWGEMRPLLNEAAGAEVLQEIILDRMVTAALTKAGLEITTRDIDRERQLFYQALDRDPNVAARLAREVRERRGLGTIRFGALLRRNAGLRALVAGQVSVTDETIQRTYQIVHGPRRQSRIIVLSDLASCEAAAHRISDGALFSDVATEISNDSSASRGGLLEPISRADPGYSKAVRETLWSLELDEVSPPVLVDGGYALIKLIREIPADGTDIDEVRPTLERYARLDQQRLLMDRLARQLLRNVSVSVYDRALEEAWQARTRPR